MIVKLFDIQNSKVVVTEHCYTLPFLKEIMDHYPNTHMQVYQYLFYMSCPNPDLNPFFNLPEQIRQSYKGAFTDMRQEQESSVRGGAGLAYDQL